MDESLKICIVGAKGMLGQEIEHVLKVKKTQIGDIDKIYEGANVSCLDLPELDITDASLVDSYFSDNKFDVIINCAAYTNCEACEENEELAHAINSDGVKNLAIAADNQAAKLVHISTDYVFSGEYANARIETDEADPISAYGRTKLEGEKLALEFCKRTFVLRTSWLYGKYGKNFVYTMLGLADKLDEVSVVADQFGNPTNANDLAYEILEIAKGDDYGIYHVTGEGICTWADLAQKSFELAGKNCKVKRVTTKNYLKDHPQSAPRPHFSALQNKHLEETIGNKMRNWEDALYSFIEDIENN